MGIFNRKANKNAQSKPQIVTDYYNSNTWLQGATGTSFSCLDRIASEFALLNFSIYDVETRQKVKKHPLYAILKQPNLEDFHFNFFYQSAVDYYNKGAYWLKVFYQGELVSLFRLNPKQVQIYRDENKKRYFAYNGVRFEDDQILYIPSRFDYSTLNGGSSIYDAVPEVFNTAKSLEGFTQKSFTNGVVGKRTVIDVSGAYPDLTTEQAKAIKDGFQAEYGGLQNAGRPILKKKGIEYSELQGTSSTDNQAAELSANRKFQKEEMGMVHAVPMGLLTGTSTNLENDFALLAEFAVRPMATQFQEAISSLLDENKYYFEFDYNGIMKTSMATRVDTYTKQIATGVLTLNEVRAKENLSPVEEGDTTFVPVNYMPWNKETKDAYMAKQKAIANGENQKESTETDEGVLNSQHSPNGDDKQ